MNAAAEPSWKRAISPEERRRPLTPGERMEMVVASAQAVAGGAAPVGSMAQEARAMANAVLWLYAALERARENDRTRDYSLGEERPDGAVPPEGEVWQTPAQIADWTIGTISKKERQDGQEEDTP